jgi:hypothetical protein
MVAAGLASWAAVSVLVDRQTSIEFLFGMLGPLAAVIGTWFVAAWAFKNHPGQSTSFLGAAFFLKLIFFPGYVAAMLLLLHLRPVPFVGSFTGYFISLYFMEALFLRRLFGQH